MSAPPPDAAPLTAEQIEAWKRMSWGHYNAPVSRMLDELARLRAALADAEADTA